MLVAVTNCVSHGGAFFFRKPREARPVECSLLDLHEIAAETGISVDEVICGLDDFGAADLLMGFGASLAEPANAREILRFDPDLTPRMAREPLFAEAQIPDLPVGATRIFPEETEKVFPVPETEMVIAAEEIVAAPVVEAMPGAAEKISGPLVAPEPEPVTAVDAEVVVLAEPEAAPIVEAEIVVEAAPVSAAAVELAEEKEEAETPKPLIEAAETKETQESKAQEAPEAALPAERPTAKAPLNIPHLDLDAIRRISTVRVEAAEPEDDGEDEPLMDLTVPEGYAVRTTTENIVWPWETREDLTLKEALESLDDHLLTSLTEEVVSCTISGEMGEGGIKSLCETYRRAKEQIYSAIQHESRRRITRMNAKPHTASAIGSDATMELAMRMAKEFLNDEMGKAKATRFQSTIPSEDGNYYIFQKHRIEDEDSVDFPNERVYYRETGDGWAISVGY